MSAVHNVGGAVERISNKSSILTPLTILPTLIASGLAWYYYNEANRARQSPASQAQKKPLKTDAMAAIDKNDPHCGDCLSRALAGNKSFSARFKHDKPELLTKLSGGQTPEILWVGCADSRCPETLICDCEPGDIFVHRNIANVVHPADLSSSAVVEFSVAVLKVQKIVVCGHTSCGGAMAALGDTDLGTTLNNWIAPVRELRRKHQAELDELKTDKEKAVRLAEINVKSSISVLLEKETVKKAMAERGLTVHGWMYNLGEAEIYELH